MESKMTEVKASDLEWYTPGYNPEIVVTQLVEFQVELADLPDGGKAMRDSRNPEVFHQFTKDEWVAFVEGVKLNEFDLPEKIEEEK